MTRVWEVAKWAVAGILFRLMAPPILLSIFEVVIPHLTTVTALALVAAKLLDSKRPQKKAFCVEGKPEFTQSPEGPTRSRTSLQACRTATRTSQSKQLCSPCCSRQGLHQYVRASQAKRSEVQNVLERVLMKRIALMGGSISREIKRFGLQEADYQGERYQGHPHKLMGNDDVLSLTCPDVVEQIYCAYLDAGVDILATNTYHSTWVSQSDYGLQDDAEVAIMNVESVRLAKRCAAAYMQQNPGSVKLVAGALGPPNKTCSDCPNEYAAGRFTYSELVDAYFKQISSLYSGGVDLFFVDLACATLESKAMLCALEQFVSRIEAPLPLVLCGIVTDSCSQMDQPVHEVFWNCVRHLSPFAVGLRSRATGDVDLKREVEGLAACCPDCYLCCFPRTQPAIADSADEEEVLGSRMLEELQPLCAEGCVNVLGDCCGYSPHHVATLRDMAMAHCPRQVAPSDPPSMWLEPPLGMPAAPPELRKSISPVPSVHHSVDQLKPRGLAV